MNIIQTETRLPSAEIFAQLDDWFTVAVLGFANNGILITTNSPCPIAKTFLICDENCLATKVFPALVSFLCYQPAQERALETLDSFEWQFSRCRAILKYSFSQNRHACFLSYIRPPSRVFAAAWTVTTNKQKIIPFRYCRILNYM